MSCMLKKFGVHFLILMTIAALLLLIFQPVLTEWVGQSNPQGSLVKKVIKIFTLPTVEAASLLPAAAGSIIDYRQLSSLNVNDFFLTAEELPPPCVPDTAIYTPGAHMRVREKLMGGKWNSVRVRPNDTSSIAVHIGLYPTEAEAIKYSNPDFHIFRTDAYMETGETYTALLQKPNSQYSLTGGTAYGDGGFSGGYQHQEFQPFNVFRVGRVLITVEAGRVSSVGILEPLLVNKARQLLNADQAIKEPPPSTTETIPQPLPPENQTPPLSGVPITIKAYADNYYEVNETIDNSGNIGLVSISGRITDLSSGQGIGGAIITITSGALLASTQSGANGNYTLTATVPAGQDSGQISGVDLALPPKAKPTLEVTVQPQYFSIIGDQSVIEATLTGEDGKPASGKPVTLVDTDTTRDIAVSNTNANGLVAFTVEHNTAERTSYNYQLQALNLTESITLPVNETGIQVEINPVTGESYRGVAADGVSTLEIMIKLDGADDRELRLTTRPSLGELRGGQLTSGGTIELINGEAIITYVPPAYLTFAQLTRHAEIYGDYDPLYGSHFTTGWAAVEPIEFSYRTADGKVTAFPLEIEVYRPPVMMVHGFTGDRTTWAEFAFDLREQKFVTHSGEYYHLDQSVPSQAIKLKENIEGQLASFKMDNVKVTRADLVVHSMGGIISRYYISSNQYGNNVRKLIMVGTPNHGCSWGDLQLGRLESWLGGKHKIAAEQLYGKSEFITTLNQGESMGLHLHKDVEYGNIYSYSAIPGFFSGDIVVPAASARLNGVRDYRVEGHSHSPAVSFMVLGSPPSITQSDQVFQKVVEWLTTKIERVPLAEVRTALVKAEGEVYVKYIDQFVLGQDLPKTVVDPSVLGSQALPIGTYDIVGTGPGSTAVLYFFTSDTRWGMIFLNENTELKLGFLSPRVSEVQLLQGSARFSSLKITEKGHYSVEIAAGDGRWQNVTGLDTDFVVTAGSTPSVHSIDGSLIFAVETASGEIASKEMAAGESYAADQGGVMTAIALPAQPWWESDFYKPSFAEQVSGLVNGFFGQLTALWALLRSGNWRNLSSADWKNYFPAIVMVASAFIAVASTSLALAKRPKRHKKEINCAAPAWFVEVTSGQSTPQMLAITVQPLKIGREPSQAQLVIGDMKVSRVHVQLHLTPENYVVLEDMGSTWGTFVNEQQITGPVYLNNGDFIRVGDTILRLVWI